MYPDDSVQNMIDEWWILISNSDYCRGRLIFAYLPHIDQIPQQLIATGRSEPTEHNSAYFRIQPLSTKRPPEKPKIPVAALPHYKNEVRTVYRAKKRPAIIISEGGSSVDKKLTLGKPKWQTAPTILVAPFYGVDEGPKRAGFKPEFIDRIRRCIYPQFMWDKLPLPGASESILRLDHIQPIGRHHDSIELTDYCLCEDAITIFDEYVHWLIWDEFVDDSLLLYFKKEMSKYNTV